MKVIKTLHEVYSEIHELRDIRDQYGRMVATAAINNSKHIDGYKKDYLHYDEVIKYLSSIAVEYEDKYETEEEE